MTVSSSLNKEEACERQEECSRESYPLVKTGLSVKDKPTPLPLPGGDLLYSSLGRVGIDSHRGAGVGYYPLH